MLLCGGKCPRKLDRIPHISSSSALKCVVPKSPSSREYVHGKRAQEEGAQQETEAPDCSACRQHACDFPNCCDWSFRWRFGSLQQSASISSRRAWDCPDIHPTSGSDSRERNGRVVVADDPSA